MARRNDALTAALKELERHGIVYELLHGGKHWKIEWIIVAHRQRIVTVPVSSSDWRGPRNSRADVRRMLRKDGIN
jgi:hypothetical protein